MTSRTPVCLQSFCVQLNKNIIIRYTISKPNFSKFAATMSFAHFLFWLLEERIKVPNFKVSVFCPHFGLMNY